MGKKRSSVARLNKVYSTASTSSAASPGSGSSLSVADKLSKLRIENLRHERNIAGTNRSSPLPSHGALPLQVTPDVSQLLGQTFVEPASRIKPRNRGHLAPKSWGKPLRKRDHQPIIQADDATNDARSSLVDLCLYQIMDRIHDYVDCGMHFLPGYAKARLLASLSSSKDDIIWHDLLPEEDDDVFELDLTATKPNLKCLRRLTSLRTVSVTAAQVESSIVAALPSVLQELIVRPMGDILPAQSTQKAYWRKLSTHFIALKVIRLDLQRLDIGRQESLDALLGYLLEGPDWREAFDTVEQVMLIVNDDAAVETVLSSVPFFGFKSSLRKLRRKGRHVECSVVSAQTSQS